MVYFIVIILFFTVLVYCVTSQEVFGAAPSGKRLERMQLLENYKDNQFHNQSFTPQLSEGHSMPKLMFNYLFGKKDSLLKPLSPVPTVYTNLKNLPKDQDIYVWLGHSSYFMIVDGVSFLIDPVLSSYGSPFKFFNKSFEGADIYKPEDIPEIDYLVITHDHYDHLDYPTVKAIRQKVKQVVLPLGVGAHLEKWGYAETQLLEDNWGTSFNLKNNIKITFTPARHFSGRKFNKNNTLWTSYVLETSSKKIFLGGDSGYDSHFKTIGEKYGAFDLAILENGQYNEAWKYIHAMPEDMVKISNDLQTTNIIPVHSGKFALALHPWNEPLKKITESGKLHNLNVFTPKIGEVLYLNQSEKKYPSWWED